jgi:prephenate dehydrogenase
VTLSVAIPEGRGGGEGILARARDFWTGLGAVPVVESAEAHDARMALASHLPQLVANGLARVLDARGVTCEALGPGGRDMTRLAASSPEMWVDLLAHGGPRLGGALRALGREMDRLAAVLERGDMGAVAEIMKETRAWRER